MWPCSDLSSETFNDVLPHCNHTYRGVDRPALGELHEDSCERSKYSGIRKRGRGGKCNVYSNLRGIHAERGRGDFATSWGFIAVNMMTWFSW